MSPGYHDQEHLLHYSTEANNIISKIEAAAITGSLDKERYDNWRKEASSLRKEYRKLDIRTIIDEVLPALKQNHYSDISKYWVHYLGFQRRRKGNQQDVEKVYPAEEGKEAVTATPQKRAHNALVSFAPSPKRTKSETPRTQGDYPEVSEEYDNMSDIREKVSNLSAVVADLRQDVLRLSQEDTALREHLSHVTTGFTDIVSQLQTEAAKLRGDIDAMRKDLKTKPMEKALNETGATSAEVNTIEANSSNDSDVHYSNLGQMAILKAINAEESDLSDCGSPGVSKRTALQTALKLLKCAEVGRMEAAESLVGASGQTNQAQEDVIDAELKLNIAAEGLKFSEHSLREVQQWAQENPHDPLISKMAREENSRVKKASDKFKMCEILVKNAKIKLCKAIDAEDAAKNHCLDFEFTISTCTIALLCARRRRRTTMNIDEGKDSRQGRTI